MFYKNWLLNNLAGKIAVPLLGLLACGSSATVAVAHAVQGNCAGLQNLARPDVTIAILIPTGPNLLVTDAIPHPLIGLLSNSSHPASLRDGDSGDKDHKHADGDKGDKGHHDGDDSGDSN